mmetsp:Transcript_812/g.2436  ORF Transcript_812/g.2436 Transcript_812/m.2436 type:complete len:212 (-) Transcript_812:22-657(-)
MFRGGTARCPRQGSSAAAPRAVASAVSTLAAAALASVMARSRSVIEVLPVACSRASRICRKASAWHARAASRLATAARRPPGNACRTSSCRLRRAALEFNEARLGIHSSSCRGFEASSKTSTMGSKPSGAWQRSRARCKTSASCRLWREWSEHSSIWDAIVQDACVSSKGLRSAARSAACTVRGAVRRRAGLGFQETFVFPELDRERGRPC